MIDLWTLIVVNLFQGFWTAVIGLCGMMYIIFMMGKVSQVTTLNFLSIFVLAMCLGYGYPSVAILITVLILIIHLAIIPKMINQ